MNRSNIAAVVLMAAVGVAALLGLGLIGAIRGDTDGVVVAEPFPTTGDSFMATPSGTRVNHRYNQSIGCISATEGGDLELVVCEGEAVGALENSTLRIAIRSDTDFNIADCIRNRSFKLSDGEFGNWCILS